MVKVKQVYEGHELHRVRVLLVRDNGMVLVENTMTGRQTSMAKERLEKPGSGFRLVQDAS